MDEYQQVAYLLAGGILTLAGFVAGMTYSVNKSLRNQNHILAELSKREIEVNYGYLQGNPMERILMLNKAFKGQERLENKIH